MVRWARKKPGERRRVGVGNSRCKAAVPPAIRRRGVTVAALKRASRPDQTTAADRLGRLALAVADPELEAVRHHDALRVREAIEDSALHEEAVAQECPGVGNRERDRGPSEPVGEGHRVFGAGEELAARHPEDREIDGQRAAGPQRPAEAGQGEGDVDRRGWSDRRRTSPPTQGGFPAGRREPECPKCPRIRSRRPRYAAEPQVRSSRHPGWWPQRTLPRTCGAHRRPDPRTSHDRGARRGRCSRTGVASTGCHPRTRSRPRSHSLSHRRGRRHARRAGRRPWRTHRVRSGPSRSCSSVTAWRRPSWFRPTPTRLPAGWFHRSRRTGSCVRAGRRMPCGGRGAPAGE